MLKIGLIGAARRGKFLSSLLPAERAKLAGLAENDPAEAAAFRDAHPDFTGKIHSDYRELLRDPEIDAVMVVCRDPLHEEMAVAALEAGKTLFLEKPMAISIEGCDRILETAFRTRTRLFVGHNMRFMPMVLKMKEIIDSGAIGEIQAVWVRHFINYGSCYFRHWCAEQRNCCGLLLQKGAHDIDVIHYLAGGFSRRVVGMGKLSVYNRCPNRLAEGEKPDRAISFRKECWPPLELRGLSPKLDVEDHNMLMMELDNGVQATYSQCMYAPDNDRNYTFIGTRGRVENFGLDEVMAWTTRGERRSPDLDFKLDVSEAGHGGADPNLIEAFVAFAAGEEVEIPSPTAARQAVAAGVLGHESARNGNVPREIPGIPQEWIDYFDGGQVRR